MLAKLVWVTTVDTGSCTGIMFRSSARTITISACLPGVSEPIRSCILSILAPSKVIQPKASRALMVVVSGNF